MKKIFSIFIICMMSLAMFAGVVMRVPYAGGAQGIIAVWIDVNTAGYTIGGNYTGDSGSHPDHAFNGTEFQALWNPPYTARAETTGYLSVDFGSAKKLNKVEVCSCSNQGFLYGSDPTITFVLQGSTDNFSSSIVDLGTTSFTDADSLKKEISTLTFWNYRYYRTKMTHNGTVEYMLMSQLKLWGEDATHF